MLSWATMQGAKTQCWDHAYIVVVDWDTHQWSRTARFIVSYQPWRTRNEKQHLDLQLDKITVVIKVSHAVRSLLSSDSDGVASVASFHSAMIKPSTPTIHYVKHSAVMQYAEAPVFLGTSC